MNKKVQKKKINEPSNYVFYLTFPFSFFKNYMLLFFWGGGTKKITNAASEIFTFEKNNMFMNC